MPINPFHISTLPEQIRTQLFQGKDYSDELIADLYKQQMGSFAQNLPKNKPFDLAEDIRLPLNRGQGSVRDTVETLAELRTLPFVQSIKRLQAAKPVFLPPNRIQFNAGWTRYAWQADRSWVVTQEMPKEDTAVFDTETMVTMRQMPLMACAISPLAVYLWINPVLCGGELDQRIKIPLGPNVKVAIQHTSFDRLRVDPLEEHPKNNWWEGRVWVDTASLHTAVAGLADEQRNEWVRQSQGRPYTSWFDAGSPKSLVHCYNHHVAKPLGLEPLQDSDKDIRDIFVTATRIDQIKGRLRELLHYCYSDVRYTFKLFSVLWSKYRRTAPSYISMAGMFIRSQTCLPVAPDWFNWVMKTEKVYLESESQIDSSLVKIAEHCLGQFAQAQVNQTGKPIFVPKKPTKKNPKPAPDVWFNPFHDDPWLSQLDWTPAKSGANKGQPAWYRQKKVASEGIGGTSSLAPLLCRLTYLGNPVYYDKVHKWGVLGCFAWGRNEMVPGGEFTAIPHPKDGMKANCGSPFSKGYTEAIESGLISADPDAVTPDGCLTPSEIFGKLKEISYWRSARSRVFNENVYRARDGKLYIIPDITVHGATTRRCTSKLWLTTCSAKAQKIGTELKSRVQASGDHFLVSMDLTSQESAIAAMFGDAETKMHGSSVFAQMCYAGTKATKTDSHSVAQGLFNQAYEAITGHPPADPLSRDDSKPATFSCLYGSGVAGLGGYLYMKRPSWGREVCMQVAKSFLGSFKGTSDWGQPLRGGLASQSFNYMSKYATTGTSPTACLGVAAPLPLQQAFAGKDFMPSRQNRLIQSTGVDQLDILQFLIGEFTVDLETVPAFTYHDEILYLAHKDAVQPTLEAITHAHSYCWAILAAALGFTTLPSSYLFPTSLNVDRCFRKEVNESVVTLSSDQDMAPGYDILPADLLAPGYDVWQGIRKQDAQRLAYGEPVGFMSTCPGPVLS